MLRWRQAEDIKVSIEIIERLERRHCELWATLQLTANEDAKHADGGHGDDGQGQTSLLFVNTYEHRLQTFTARYPQIVLQ